MALRNQPYIPLYVQDFLTDEKLMECSATSTGVYVRLMCIMHKSDEYGTILLKKKDKKTSKNIQNFAEKLAKHMPYTMEVIHSSLHELINEGVIQIKGLKLFQKRMLYDNDLSEKRAKAGQKGGKKTKEFATTFAGSKKGSKIEANAEYEYEDEIAIEYGVYKNVLLSSIDYKRLIDDYGETLTLHWIKELDEGLELKGYKYKNHYVALRKWMVKGGVKTIEQNKGAML